MLEVGKSPRYTVGLGAMETVGMGIMDTVGTNGMDIVGIDTVDTVGIDAMQTVGMYIIEFLFTAKAQRPRLRVKSSPERRGFRALSDSRNWCPRWAIVAFQV